MPTPSMVRFGKVAGCAIHGHIMRFGTEEVTMLPNDPIFESRIVRIYKCINCPHTAEQETLTLKDEFIEE